MFGTLRQSSRFQGQLKILKRGFSYALCEVLWKARKLVRVIGWAYVRDISLFSGAEGVIFY